MARLSTSLTLRLPEGSCLLPALRGKATSLQRSAALLSVTMPPADRQAIADLARVVECEATNHIEGYAISRDDIESALKGHLAADAHIQDLQRAAMACVAVLKHIDSGAYDDLGTGSTLVQALHRNLFGHPLMPKAFLQLPGGDGHRRLVPGAWRREEVAVGQHDAPPAVDVPALMAHFDRGYRVPAGDDADALLGAFFAHHRLLWIHPFSDGNGRVARLHLRVMLRRAGLHPELWSMSNGLAHAVSSYHAALARADYPPQSMLDGRGSLSDSGLAQFADHMLDTAAATVGRLAGLCG